MGAVEHTGDGTVGDCYGACERFTQGFVRLTLADAVAFAKIFNADNRFAHNLHNIGKLLFHPAEIYESSHEQDCDSKSRDEDE